MFVVRYVALAALVFWLGGSVVVLAGGVSARFHLVAAGCGAVIVICLFIMKFVGPPPPAFALRAGLAFTMTVMGLYSGDVPRASSAVTAVQVALGFILLAWYARE